MHEDSIQDKAVTALIREIDTGKNKLNYTQSKLPEHWDWLDAEARNIHEGVRLLRIGLTSKRPNHSAFRHSIKSYLNKVFYFMQKHGRIEMKSCTIPKTIGPMQ